MGTQDLVKNLQILFGTQFIMIEIKAFKDECGELIEWGDWKKIQGKLIRKLYRIIIQDVEHKSSRDNKGTLPPDANWLGGDITKVTSDLLSSPPYSFVDNPQQTNLISGQLQLTIHSLKASIRKSIHGLVKLGHWETISECLRRMIADIEAENAQKDEERRLLKLERAGRDGDMGSGGCGRPGAHKKPESDETAGIERNVRVERVDGADVSILDIKETESAVAQ
ncbi:hypothetical protein IFR05_017311, partial [Cadophora sp. M221]